jgi:hypothetical protein
MTRLIAVLSWFDEPLPLLASCLEGMARGGVDHLVAVDGAYRLFPGGEARSHIDQHAVLAAGTKQYGIGLTLVVPSTVWAGNEVEKREYAFRQALAASGPGDWFWSLDADEIITAVPDDLKDRLEDAAEDAALIGVTIRSPPARGSPIRGRRTFRRGACSGRSRSSSTAALSVARRGRTAPLGRRPRGRGSVP